MSNTDNTKNNMPLVQTNLTSSHYKMMLESLGYSFRLNEVTNMIEVNGKPITDSDVAKINLDMVDRNFPSRKMIEECYTDMAAENKYHPVKEYFDSLVWDNVPRLKLIVDLLHPAKPELAKVLFTKWMIGVVAKVMEQSQNVMLVLEGGQGIGKSFFARWLCPETLNDYYREDYAIDPKDKDYKIAACKTFLWEVGELGATIRKADREQLKGFITEKNHSYREAYAKHPITKPALASFIGTINNESGFLDDPTGNRRFWIMAIGEINHCYSTIYNVNDLWAEAYARYLEGESYTLTPEESAALEETQEDYRVVNMTAEAMKKYYQIDPNNQDWVEPIINITLELKRQGISEKDTSPQKMGAARKELGLQQIQKKINGVNKKCYVGISKKITTYE